MTEYSLSIDNLFVFVIIMARFSVPRKYQQEVLMVGVIIALVLRGIFILLGAQLIENFSWIFYIFGAFLLFTAIQQVRENHDEMEERENGVIRFLRKRIAISNEFDGVKIRTVVDGKKIFTPILIVFIAIGTTDLVFALDSIPAIFGITHQPVHRLHRERVRPHGAAAAVLPARRPHREARLPALRDRVHPRLHRREARLPRAAPERAAVHQRR